YNLALISTSTDPVKYASREASSGKPQLLVTLAQNTAPLVTITAPAPGTTVDPSTPLTLRATATDAESGDLGNLVTWRSDLDGPLGWGATRVVSTLRPGLHTITASATDAGGQSGLATITVRVDGPPVIAITAPASGSEVTTGTALTLAATASDPDDGDLAAAV